MRKSFRSVGIALGGAAMIVATSVMSAVPAGAVSASALDCTGRSAHQNVSDQPNSIRADRPVRSGLYEECSIRFYGQVPATLHCYQKNGRGNVWWFVQTSRGQGWVFKDNLGKPAHEDRECAGAVQPVPA